MKRIHVLLVEDNEGDILLTKEALMEGHVVDKITVLKNGKDAIYFLLKQDRFAEAQTPDLVLLDINLPLKSGHEVLKIIKNHPDTRHIPIIVLTTSSSVTDVNNSYREHANCYITKPVEVDEFLNAVATIEDFWINLAVLPNAR